jgi:hypothetical protein
VIARDPRTVELAEQVRAVVPIRDAADEFAIQSLAILLVRIERAAAAIEELDAQFDAEGSGPLAVYLAEGEKFDALRKDLRSWLSVSERYFAALGLTPGSRARLGLDVARARSLNVVDWHTQVALEEASK